MGYTITVFGLGFVGLTTALAFAEHNNTVYGVDVDDKRANMIRSGRLPFVEPGLDEALHRHIDKKFFISNDVEESVKNSDFIFLCVGTPCRDNGEADLRYIYSAIDMFASIINDGKYRVVVIKSTVPPSTTSEMVIPYLEKKGLFPGATFSVANNPEFLRECYCWDDMINADRIVCGVLDSKAEDMLRSLYSSFNTPFFAVTLNTGEFIKYLSNTFLSTLISYSNEMSKIADAIGGIQIREAFEILHLDKRWKGSNMTSYLYPGCGFGGYCLPKDTQAMYAKASSKGYEPLILKNVIETNKSMPKFMADKIFRVSKKTDKIGILGLSFKPGSDDVRDSPSAKIIKILLDEGYTNIGAYDPLANEQFMNEYKFNIKYYSTLKEICENSDIAVLVTAWDEFRILEKEYKGKIIDCRYFLKV